MIELIVPIGPPGSGKTTDAIKWVEEHTLNKKLIIKRVRVGRDDIRQMLFNGIYRDLSERTVRNTVNNLIVSSLNDGFSVYADETFMNPGRVKEMLHIIRDLAVRVEFRDFSNKSYQECVMRDRERRDKKPVGESVISQDFFKKYIANSEWQQWKNELLCKGEIACKP